MLQMPGSLCWPGWVSFCSLCPVFSSVNLFLETLFSTISLSSVEWFLLCFTELSWARKNGLRRMYFGKIICCFLIYPRYRAHGIYLSWIWNYSWLWSICLDWDWIKNKKESKQSNYLIFKLFLTNSRKGDSKIGTRGKKCLTGSETRQTCYSNCELTVLRHVKQFLNKGCPLLRWRITPCCSCLSTALACKHW